MSEKQKKTPRIHITLGHDMADRLAEVREITGLASDADAARYLMSRGIEGISAHLNNHRMMKRLEAQYSPQEMLPMMQALEDEKRKGTESR